jgi:hypothetical protein
VPSNGLQIWRGAAPESCRQTPDRRTEGLVEEIQSRGSIAVWRRDDDGPRSLRINTKGLQAIRIEDEASGAAEPTKKPPAPSAKARKAAKSTDRSPKSQQAEPASSRADSKRAGLQYRVVQKVRRSRQS